MKCQAIFLSVIFSLISCSVSATTIFSDDFQDGNFDGWTIGGNGRSATASYYNGNYNLRLRRTKIATQTISTSNFTSVSIATSIAAYSLEGSDRCVAEVSTNGGSGWQTVNQVVNGQDNGVTLYTATATPSGIDNNNSVTIRLKAAANGNGDYCYFDDILVEGTSESEPPPGCDYDCLSGDGNVNRTNLSYSTLQTTGNGSLVDLAAYALPTGAANPTNIFEGSLNFSAVARGWISVKDTYNYAAINNVKKLPDYNYQFVQHGTHLIPVDRGLQITNHNLWELILEPGRVWDENGDNGFSRVSLPFALQEYGANCTHNGVMTFLFKTDGSISSVAYEIASETCEYYQYNLYGLLSASYTPGSVANAAQIKVDYETEVGNRIATKPLSDLAIDYPSSGINTNIIAGEQTAANLSAFGVSYNGVHYTGACDTRYGGYPFCDVMSLPSYSVAKSVFTSYGLMAIEQSFPGAKSLSIGDYVGSCPASRWADVSWENTLDMATGNYTDPGFEVDEGSSAMSNGFFLDYTDSGKTSFSCSYPRKVTPGNSWVYHSSDSYLLAKSMDQYLLQDSYDWLVSNIYQPLGVSPVMNESVRTFDSANQSMGGYGLTMHRDDLLKLAELLNNDNGQIGGQQKLNLTMVNQVLQKTSYHGLNAGSVYDWYDNGFWIWKADEALACSNDLYIPYMSGFGGIAAVLLPNNMIYYFFSDNKEYTFSTTVQELDKIGDFCN